ncbi:MAG TPA: phosphoribosylaminoimidazolesuccinocarboxamide synthase [Balneolales bacterium]|nr:phosphoribosylaminoimidazolesuccinocarboxamide synthase [Balneolales bacterium]
MNISEIDRKQALNNCITHTQVDYLPEPYRGKVRDVYTLNEHTLGIVASDRISAFDHILKQPIPFKGQILNTIAAFFFEKVKDIVDTHVIDVPHPNVTIAKKCESLPVEVVIRGYLVGHSWRVYNSGERTLCGVSLPEGLKENQRFEKPILTPATKAKEGHDEDISEEEIIKRGIVGEELWHQIRQTAFKLFDRGQQIANKNGLILVDTKYEFGLNNGQLVLIDEVHTPDSSRYFYADGYEERLEKGERQKQLSKEFIREWLMSKGFQGKEGQQLPDMSDEFRWIVFERYSELFEIVTGQPFEPVPTDHFDDQLAGIFKKYK